MSILNAVHSEIINSKHIIVYISHILIALLGTLLFISYFVMYSNNSDLSRIKLMFEILLVVFPFLISVMVGLNISQEEKASHFQILLSSSKRYKMVLSKLIVLCSCGNIALIALCVFWTAGIIMFNAINKYPLIMIALILVGTFLTSIVVYTFHMFLNLKLGIGVSLFFGIFESIQAIMYSNIEIKGIYKYIIPFAWQIDWLKDVMNGTISQHVTQWLIIGALSLVLIGMFFIWFQYWEGRKYYE